MIPFVVVGHPRSGSTLLKESLAQHPLLKIYSELFHAVEEERRKRHFVRRQGDTVVYYRGGDQDGLEFLGRHVWSRANQRFSAVGFKLFSEHVECPGTDRLMERLREVPGLRVLNIVRGNLLDMWVSRQMAEQSGVWREAVNPKSPVPRREVVPLAARPEALLAYFERLSAETDEVRRMFGGPHYLEVGYDSLAGRFQQTMDSVFSFLSVDPVACAMTIRKQNTLPHSEFLTNYSELKRHFSASKYASFFPDP